MCAATPADRRTGGTAAEHHLDSGPLADPNLVLAEHMAETATTPGVPDPAQLAELTQAHRRLARSLQPQGDDRGMLVALATWLGADRASRLAGMVGRAIAGAYERGHAEG
jgi:hypothetical protein